MPRRTLAEVTRDSWDQVHAVPKNRLVYNNEALLPVWQWAVAAVLELKYPWPHGHWLTQVVSRDGRIKSARPV